MNNLLKGMPYALQRYFAKSEFEQVTVGMSFDTVYRVLDDEVSYLKIGKDLQSEYDRLQWLENKLPVPKVLHYEVHNDIHYLMLSQITGAMAHERTKRISPHHKTLVQRPV